MARLRQDGTWRRWVGRFPRSAMFGAQDTAAQPEPERVSPYQPAWVGQRCGVHGCDEEACGERVTGGLRIPVCRLHQLPNRVRRMRKAVRCG